MEIDYEKKYEEALAKARAGKTLEEIFPEMNESEDERIRKELLAVINDLVLPDEQKARFNAWLEKQKEQKQTIQPHNPDGSNPYDMRFAEAQNYINERGLELPWNDGDIYIDCFHLPQTIGNILRWADEHPKEQKLTESISRLTVQGKGVYKICPRCKECMVRDDSKVYTSMPPQYGYKCPRCGTMEFDTVMYDNPKMEEQNPAEYGDEFIAEAEEYASKVNCGEYKVEVTEAYIAGALRANNKPAEWSEEDESQLDDIEKAISNYFDLNHAPQYHYWLEEKLKSLRPQPKQDVFPSLKEKEIICLKRALDYLRKEHNRYGGEDFTNEIAVLEWLITHPILVSNSHWKPSEEQMEALDKALYYVPEEIGIPIAEIYGHFNKMKKKLM